MTDTTTINGISAISRMFELAGKECRSAFLPYYPVGYPNYVTSLDAIEAMAGTDVDGFEIGIPFSDPLADGPTIQAATQIALENGVTVRRCLEAIAELRQRGVGQPMLMMGYLNPLLAYGPEAFARDAARAGACGLIVPDLPPEETALFSTACEREGLALVLFLAPTSTEQRIRLVAERATGFIYVVSLTGVTGARDRLPPDVPYFIQRVRAVTDMPLVLGFGISTPEHVRAVNGQVEGFIVGSALVRAGEEGVEPVRQLAKRLRAAASA